MQQNEMHRQRKQSYIIDNHEGSDANIRAIRPRLDLGNANTVDSICGTNRFFGE